MNNRTTKSYEKKLINREKVNECTVIAENEAKKRPFNPLLFFYYTKEHEHTHRINHMEC